MKVLRPLAVAVALAAAGTAAAQSLQVIPVPWVATDPTVPHLAYNGHATTFKAIARGGDGTYVVEWDFQGDGVYDTSATTNNRYDLSARYTLPAQASDTTFLVRVRVTSGSQTVVATYPVRVLADVPADPALATDRQLQVQRDVAIDDGLWYLHKAMVRTGSETDPVSGAGITGSVGGAASPYASPSYLEALGMSLHYPAFPAAYAGELPDALANATRWATDPYAEDAARLVNYLLLQGAAVSIAAQDESNLTGFSPELSATPIPGTDDGIGFWIGRYPGDLMSAPHSNALRALALAHLTGHVAQVGDVDHVLGRRFEFLIQQMVDALVWAQNDTGYVGAWDYYPNSGGDLLGEFMGGVLDAEEALLQVERSTAASGVVVPNLAKARLAAYIQQSQNYCPTGGRGGAWSASLTGCDLALSAANVVAWGWVGANLASISDSGSAFPGYNAMTFGQLRTYYDGSRIFIDGSFDRLVVGPIRWDTGFVADADFSRLDGRGDHWSMLHWTRAARAVTPELLLFGTWDHPRLFARYLVRNQATTGGWNWVRDDYALYNYNDEAVGPDGRAAWAILVLSRDGMAPVAHASFSPAWVSEGATVTFRGTAFASGAEYAWTFGDGTAATGETAQHVYADNGAFNPTLTVTNRAGVSTHSIPVTVVNAAPVAQAGLDQTADEGDVVHFAGSATDAGADTLFATWRFGDATSASGFTATHVYADQGTFSATLTVSDDDGGVSTDTAIITVRNVSPRITSTPPQTTPEGELFAYTLTFVEPGLADTDTCTAQVKPQGATLSGCTLSWTPTYAHLAAPVSSRLCVTDDDGGSDCQSFQLTVTPMDADADGLSDTWEEHFFGDIASQAGSDDPDFDGVPNADEYLAATDPTSWDGPAAPAALAPACGAKVTSARPTLGVANPFSPTGVELTYEFEVMPVGTTTPVAAGRDVAAGAESTSWTLDVALTEDATYTWRARASHGAVVGPWNASDCAFTVDAVAPPSSKGGCGTGGAPTATALLALAALALRRRGGRVRVR